MNSSIKSFTIIELLIVLGVISILSAIAVVVLNPAELLKQGRDSTRIQDIRGIDTAINLGRAINPSLLDNTSSSIVYISLPDTDSDGLCDEYTSLPSLKTPWEYRCVASSTPLHNVDGTGWIPIDFTAIAGGSNISTLPIDPKNEESNNRYYTYSLISSDTFSLSSELKSQKYLNQVAVKDGGNSTSTFETAPIAWTTTTGSTTFTWDGSVSTSWDDGSNWDQGTVPGITDNAIIPDVVNDPVLASATTINDLTIQSAGALNLAGYGFTVSGTFSNDGTLKLYGSEAVSLTMDTDSGLVKYTGSGTYTSLAAGNSYSTVEFSGSGTWTLNNNLSATDNFLVSGGTINTNDYNITANGNFTVSSSTLNAGATIITVGGSWDSSLGTFEQDTSTVIMTGTNKTITPVAATGWSSTQFYNLTIASGATITTDTTFNIGTFTGGATTISGTLTISNGTRVNTHNAVASNIITINSSGEIAGLGTFNIYDFNGGFHLTNNGVISVSTFKYTFAWATSGIITATTYGGNLIITQQVSDWTDTAIVTRASGDTTSNLVVNGTLTILPLATDANLLTVDNSTNNIDVVAQNLLVGDSSDNTRYGKLICGSANYDINGDTIIYNGSSNNEINADTSNWTVSGNWTNNDTFTADSSVITFDGAGTSVITGNTTFNNLTNITAGKQLTFTAGSNQTIGGTLTLTGTSGNEINLRSSSASTYNLTFPNGPQTVNYVDVQYSNALTNTITANNSIDGGNNNANWLFP
ncbi:MAG TPA: hypothetical protein ENH26_02655 [Candidatus Wolfebacteria bacterium]|nr:hypothetical protein [Candidatus Wolfebacteria bacterium]